MSDMLQRPANVLIPPPEIDVVTSPGLARSIFERSPDQRLVLELRDVTFCDSSGLAVLLRAHEYLRGGGGSLILRDPSEAVLRLLTITELHHHFTLEPDPGETAPLLIDVENLRGGGRIAVTVHQRLTPRVVDHLLRLAQMRQPDELLLEIHAAGHDDEQRLAPLGEAAVELGGVLTVTYGDPCPECAQVP